MNSYLDYVIEKLLSLELIDIPTQLNFDYGWTSWHPHGIHIYIHKYTHTYIQTGRQTDRQTDRQADRQTDRQADRQTDRQTCRCS